MRIFPLFNRISCAILAESYDRHTPKASLCFAGITVVVLFNLVLTWFGTELTLRVSTVSPILQWSRSPGKVPR